MKELAKQLLHATFRALARFVPPGALYWLLLPYSATRALPTALRPDELPVRHLPPLPGDRPPSFFARWRFQTANRHRGIMWIWRSEWQKPRWRQRIRETGPGTGLPTDRPLVIVALHTRGMDVLHMWLRSRGLAIGGVALPPIWEMYGALRGRQLGDSGFQMFPTGDARSIIRFLTPGKCLVLAADHPLGRIAEGGWDGGRLRLSIGGFRIARQTGAAVVPVIVTDAGRWQFDVHVGLPVPQSLIEGHEYEAAVSHIARELMPIAAARPAEAFLTLVKALSGLGQALTDGERDRA